jgi:hypothetical protein
MMRSIRVTQVLLDGYHSDRVSDLTFEAVDIDGSRNSYGEEVNSCSILSNGKNASASCQLISVVVNASQTSAYQH